MFESLRHYTAEAVRRLRRAVSALLVCTELDPASAPWQAGSGRPALAPGAGRAAAAALMTRYRSAAPLLTDSDPREQTPADSLAAMAANALATEVGRCKLDPKLKAPSFLIKL